MSSWTIEYPSARTVGLKTIGRLVVAVKPIARWIDRIRSEHRLRRQLHELRGLDDRMLADIGLTRDVVSYAVRHGHLPPVRDLRRQHFD